MNESLNLSVVLPSPCDIEFSWYEEIRDGLLRRTVGQAQRILDVGCGPGNVLLTLAEQIGEGIGIDVSQEFLDQAERARQAQGLANVRFQHADATALPFPDGGFDVVVSALSLFFLVRRLPGLVHGAIRMGIGWILGIPQKWFMRLQP